MSDYEAKPRKMKRLDIYYIPGQTEQLSKDVHDADAAGISYGTQIGRKRTRLRRSTSSDTVTGGGTHEKQRENSEHCPDRLPRHDLTEN